MDGIFTEISTKTKCDSNNWNVTAGRMSGKSETARTFNAFLDTLQQRVFEAKRKLIKTDKKLTAENIKNLVIGKDTRKSTWCLRYFNITIIKWLL